MTSLIGVVQMNTVADFEKNLAFVEQQLAQAADQGIDLITFPETFLYIGNDHQTKHQVAQALDGDMIAQFRYWAQQYDLSILMGSIYEKTPENDDRLFNTSVLINRQGELGAVYRKIHMCDAPNLGHIESTGIRPGSEIVVIDHEVGKLGFSICYDLRFPELYKSLAQQGAEIIFVPSAFFLHTGKHHWLPLLIARAIENQVYIVAPNQWGEHYQGRTSYGSSVIIDPWGSVITCAPERACMVSAQIDLDYLRQVRSNMPVHAHGRPELYT